MTALIFLCAAVSYCPPAKAQYETEAEELILAVTYTPYMLSGGIIALQQDNRYYLPVLELADIFDFYTDAELERGYVSGFFINEENRFAIDLEHGFYSLKGERKDLPPVPDMENPYATGAADLYILVDVLNEIWPVTMDVNLQNLALVVSTQERLPFELALERQDRRKIAIARQAGREAPDLPFIPNPYSLLGPPAVDLQTDFSWREQNAQLTGTTTATGVQEIAGTVADYTVSVPYYDSSFHVPDNVRLRFTREAFGDESMILGLTKVQGGDVRVQHQDLISSGSSGRGIIAFSDISDTERQFDEITIEGIAVPGWEIELYRNNELLEFGTVPSDGEYRFENVPLEAGNNQIRTVLYGPQGQIQERVENHRIGGSMVLPGKTVYTVGAIDSDREFLLLSDEPRIQPRGFAGNAYVAHGLNRNLTLFGSAARLPTRQGRKEYVTAGIASAALGGLGQLQYYKEIEGGSATQIQFATRLMGLSLNLKSAIFNEFESTNAGFGSNLKTWESDVRLNKSFRTFLGSLGVQLSANHVEREVSLPTSNLANQLTLSRSGLRLSNQLNSSYQDYTLTNASGRFGGTYRMKNWQVRSQLGYLLYPETDLTNLEGEVRYRREDGLSAAVSGQYQFADSIYGAGLQFGYDFDRVLASFDVDWLKEQGFQFMVRASTSLAPYGPDGDYIMASKKLSRNSPVRALIFMDNDGDLTFSEGDEPLEGAGLNIGRRGSANALSNEDGLIVFPNAPEGLVNVTINENTLIDPYYKPAIDGYATVARTGSMPYLEFPIVETGAIDGTVARESGTPVSGMRLELVNDIGEIIATTETAYDGYYTFEFVEPGTYTVRADPTYEVNVPPETATVTSEDPFVYGVDLYLLEQAEEVEATLPLNDEEAAADSGVAQTPTGVENGTVPAPSSDESGFSVFVQRVRIGVHPGKARLVLELSGPVAAYETTEIEGGKIRITLPDIAWDAVREWSAEGSNAVLQTMNVSALEEGGTELTVSGNLPLAVGEHALLSPIDGEGYRLYFDLHDH